MKTRALVFLALLCFFPLLAHSANAWNERDLTTTAPTACTDGSPIAQCMVTGYKWEAAGNCTATSWNALGTTAANVLTYHASNLVAGTYCFRVKATSAGGDSGPSLTTTNSQTTVTAPLPAPPGAVSVSAAVAYEIRPNSTGVLTATRIGVIPLGSPCQSDIRTVGGVAYNRVAPSSVDLINWPAKIPPVDVFALCSTTG